MHLQTKLFFLLVLICRRDVFTVNITAVERLSHLIEKFCPASNVCPEFIDYPPAISKESISSCCKACSCRADCENNYNCCFPNSTFGVHDDIRGDLKQTTYSCLWAATFEPNNKIFSNIKAYTMVSDVKESGNTSCGDTSVAIWGSLHPVYSKKTKLIYKNSACAHAHDVTDGVLWNVLISCDEYDADHKIKADLNSIVAALESQTFPNYCQVIFEYPGQKDDVATHVCYKDLIDSCPNTDFKLASSNESNVSKQIIRESCSSGLLAPYFRGGDIYANVFCYVCHGNEFSPEMMCFDTGDRDLFQNNFVGVIDNNIMLEQVRKKPNVPHACLASGSADSNCRPLICPAGQIRTKLGDCILFSTWQVKPIAVHLNLTSTVSLNMTELLPSGAKMLYDLTFLSNPWPYYWRMFSLGFDFLEAEYTKSIFVSLKLDNPSNQPRRIIRNIMENLEKPWTLYDRHLGRNTTLRADFSKFYLSLRERPDVFNQTNIKLYTVFVNNWLDESSVHFYVNKLHVCDQVELDASEFELSFDSTVLYNKIAGCYMWDGEFSIIPGKDGLKARICMDGSGFVAASAQSSLLGRSMPIIGLLWMLSNCFDLK